MSEKIGLVLTGGGARSAYQVGVLKAISEDRRSKEIPFKIVSSLSAGSINAAFITAQADDFKKSTAHLWEIWAGLCSKDVFHTDALTLGYTGLSWILKLSLGEFVNIKSTSYLLNTEPLRKLLKSNVDFSAIRKHIAAGILDGVSVSATNYESGQAVIFFDGTSKIGVWKRNMQKSERTNLSLDHVMASCAIPFIFPSVKIDSSFYGDGCIRHSAPASSAIHMGADRILAIGIRHPQRKQISRDQKTVSTSTEPSVAEIGGTLFNSVFLEDLEGDIERTRHINELLKLIPPKKKAASGIKNIPIMAIRPSVDLSVLARKHFVKLPFALKHVFRGVGASEEKGWDFLSYLTFDKAFTVPLMELGYTDANKNREAILDFLFSSSKVVQLGTA